MWSDDDNEKCPYCNTTDVVFPAGPSKSPVLMIGEFPGADEIKIGRPFVGATGGVLRAELGVAGISMARLRMCNLWIHAPNDNPDCLKFGIELAIKEASNRKAVLLIGSDVVKYFCNMSVMDVNGLQVTSSYLSNPIIMACVQPTTVFHGSLGELRFAIKKFAIALEQDKIL